MARPALDSVGCAVDRVKMAIYTQFAAMGLPCPITGHPNTGRFAGGDEQSGGGGGGQQQQSEGSGGGVARAAAS